MDLLQKFKAYISKNNLFSPKDKLLLAVSGGVDSVVLTELCHQAGFNFAIAHCNFQLRGLDSNRDEDFVQQLSKKYGVEFFVKKFNTKEFASHNKLSIQEAARDLRYNWFEEIVNGQLAMGNASGPTIIIHIVTGHHADDNIETVLMNFFRGTGIRGIKGIEPKQGKVVRPLLFARRKELEEFLASNNLNYVQDASNLEDDYTRNYFRNQLIPSIEKVFPDVNDNILDNIERLSGVAKIYEEAITLQKRKMVVKKGNELNIPVLKLSKHPAASTILHEITKEYGFSSLQLKDVYNLLQSSSGKYVASSTHRIIRNRKWLIIVPLQNEIAEHILIEKPAAVESPIGKLNLELKPNSKFPIPNSPLITYINADNLQFPLMLRKWKSGDYFYPLGMRKKKKLARFFIDQKFSKTDKEKVWVLEMDKKILWVIGHRIDDRFKVTPETKNVLQLTRRQER